MYQQGDEFIGVGVDNGLLKLVWGMDGPTDNKILILAASVADGEWHNLILNFSPNNITLWVDRILEHSESSPGHSDSQPLTTDGVFYLGRYHYVKTKLSCKYTTIIRVYMYKNGWTLGPTG